MAKLFQNYVPEIRQLHIGNVSDPKVPEIQNRGMAIAHVTEENRSTFGIGVNETRV